ncbi:hypothetical protein JCGZ_24041 [Jatropha curcas]|uniref:Uncharacterized protein n=1 Tax=Jatropha curcas TaxID=180498 RepID=A0A067LEM8_JATCU|nr:hypothetical protein JCGZ_24041 [Jatropha curcas]
MELGESFLVAGDLLDRRSLDRSEEQPSVPAWLEWREASAMAGYCSVEQLRGGATWLSSWWWLAFLLELLGCDADAVTEKKKGKERKERKKKMKKKGGDGGGGSAYR